jgi:ribosomal-protein-alanine N-acetyltransferase
MVEAPRTRIVVAGELTLEPQVAAHADEMFDVLSDPAIYTYENAPPQSLAGLRERYAELESRRSPNGREWWFNWVVRLARGPLIGYVQATVVPDGHAGIAYEFHSRHWGRGLGTRAVAAMLGELAAQHDVRDVTAVLKRENQRSLRLLERLGFALASAARHAQVDVERDELLMERSIGPRNPT